MPQNINTVAIESAFAETDYMIISVNGTLRRVLVGDLIKMLESNDPKITIDTELSEESSNPVENKAVAKEVKQLKNDLAEKQPKGNYALASEVEALSSAVTDLQNEQVTEEDISELGFWKETDGKEYVDSEITDLEIRVGQQHLLFAEGETVEEALTWLETNGDTTKVYVLPDGFFYEYKETIVETGGVAYTNLLPTATDTDRTTIYNGVGYSDGSTRLSSSGSTSSATAEAMRASGFIAPVVEGDIVRIKNMNAVSGVNAYCIAYDSSNTKTNYQTLGVSGTVWQTTQSWCDYDSENNLFTITMTSELFGSNFNAIRFSGGITEDTIVTVNEEIKEGGGTAIVETWASSGQAFVPTEYDSQIANLTASSSPVLSCAFLSLSA